MILPIRLTDQLGLPGQGVPSFTLDPNTGDVIGAARWPAGAAAIDAATGEPATDESSWKTYDVTGVDFANDPTLWDTPGAPFGVPGVVNVASIRDSRGPQWARQGSYLTESAFDMWRKAGKPSRCSMRGLRGSTFPDGSECAPGSSPLCMSTAQRIEAGIIAGTQAAFGPGYYAGGAPAGYGAGSGGSVTVSGAANPLAWVFGGLIVVGLVFAVARR